MSINVVHHPFKKHTLSLLSRKKRCFFLFFMCLLFVLYLFTFCACHLFVGLLSRKKKLFVHLVLSASRIFVRLGFICLFLCMLLWFYIFHGLEYNIFTFSVA